MAIIDFLGTAPLIQQVTTVTVGGTISGETFTVYASHPSGTVGSTVEIASHTDSDGSASSAATALAAAWNASKHPFAAGVNGIGGATAEASSGTITFTAKTAGIPFVLSLNTPGGSATFTKSTTTANSGPDDLSAVGNYAGGALATAADSLFIRHRAIYGLDAYSAVSDLAELHLVMNGPFGTNEAPVQINSDKVFIDAPGGTAHLMFLLANTITEFRVRRTSSIANDYAVKATIGTSGNTVALSSLIVEGGSLSLGDLGEDDSNVAAVTVRGGRFRVNSTSQGLSTALHLIDGEVLLKNGPATITQQGGTLIMDGGATTVTINGGMLVHRDGNITTLNGNAGIIDCLQSVEPRTIATLNQDQACTLKWDDDYTSITTHNKTGPMVLQGFSAVPNQSRARR